MSSWRRASNAVSEVPSSEVLSRDARADVLIELEEDGRETFVKLACKEHGGYGRVCP
jgi:hypothetical protein